MIHPACYCSRMETAHFISASDVFGSNVLLNRTLRLSLYLPVSLFTFLLKAPALLLPNISDSVVLQWGDVNRFLSKLMSEKSKKRNI